LNPRLYGKRRMKLGKDKIMEDWIDERITYSNRKGVE